LANETVQTEPEQPAASLKDTDVAISIKSLQDDALQLSELNEMEKSYSQEVIAFLKQLIEPLGASYRIKPQSVSRSDSSLQDVILTPQGIVFLMYNTGQTQSRPLENLQTETLVRILMEVMPSIKTLLSERRAKMTGRVGMLEKMTREFRKVTVVPLKKPAMATSPSPARDRASPDAMKSQLTGQ
jgi:hypothetical protein